MKQNSLPMAGYHAFQEEENYQKKIESIHDTLRINGIDFLINNPTGHTAEEKLEEIRKIIEDPYYEGI